MQLKMQSTLFAIALAAFSAVSAPNQLWPSALGQGAPATPSTAQNGSTFADGTKANGGVSGVEVLSDTRGVDFNPYLKEMLAGIYGRWTGLLPEEARKPTLAKGETDIRFIIRPDGQIAAMHLDANTHDDQLNKAAWGAVTGVQQFPPLPAAFTGPSLEVRVHFRVNLDAAGDGRS